MMITLRPGHGLTPPGPLAYGRYSRANNDRPDAAFPDWSLQRPGNKEDLYTAQFCGEYLIPALVAAGHELRCQRAIDPVTGELDTTLQEVGPEIFPQLGEDQRKVAERWQFNAAVEAVLRGVMPADWARGYGWSHDPVVSARWERKTRGDVYLSVHQNWWKAPSCYGPAVYHCTGSTKGRQLAQDVYQAIVEAFKGDPWAEETRWPWGTPARRRVRNNGSRWGVYDDRYTELQATAAPAVLVELAFSSNPDDAARMGDPEWCRTMAHAIAQGLAA